MFSSGDDPAPLPECRCGSHKNGSRLNTPAPAKPMTEGCCAYRPVGHSRPAAAATPKLDRLPNAGLPARTMCGIGFNGAAIGNSAGSAVLAAAPRSSWEWIGRTGRESGGAACATENAGSHGCQPTARPLKRWPRSNVAAISAPSPPGDQRRRCVAIRLLLLLALGLQPSDSFSKAALARLRKIIISGHFIVLTKFSVV